MAATEMTASYASGYLTDVAYYSVGPRLIMDAHYSSPSSGSMYIDTQMQYCFFIAITNADLDTVYQTAEIGNGMQRVYFSGWTTGLTGGLFIWGQ